MSDAGSSNSNTQSTPTPTPTRHLLGNLILVLTFILPYSITLMSLYHKSLDTPPVRFWTVSGGIVLEIVIAILYAHSTLCHPSGVLLQALNYHISITILFAMAFLTVAKPLHIGWDDNFPTTIISIILWFLTSNIAGFLFWALVTIRSSDEQLGLYSRVHIWYRSIWNVIRIASDVVVLFCMGGCWGLVLLGVKCIQALMLCRCGQELPESFSLQSITGMMPPPQYSFYDTETLTMHSTESIDFKV
ncbi:hypothetical protein EDB19DRAFT_2034521 [Suillus lakei]|nr:hypothetical protein EDB19DRAFT_2034521 [Suillus lakei]